VKHPTETKAFSIYNIPTRRRLLMASLERRIRRRNVAFG